MTTPVFAGNWKLNHGPDATRAFLARFEEQYAARDDRTVIFFPPAISLQSAAQATQQRPDLNLGVQNIHWEPEGAFTGEVGAPMAAEAGATFALVGHSERRHLFGESDEQARLKTAAAFDGGLTPVLCLGETLDQRKAGAVDEVIVRQLDAALEGLPDERVLSMLIAYEPVWAIGTGVTATPADAEAAHRILRRRLVQRCGEQAASIPILYGGSVKPDNAAALLEAGDVNGLLVGGASLDPDTFLAIANT